MSLSSEGLINFGHKYIVESVKDKYLSKYLKTEASLDLLFCVASEGLWFYNMLSSVWIGSTCWNENYLMPRELEY